MNKTTKTILIIIASFLVVFFVLYFFGILGGKNNNESPDGGGGIGNLFPFGDSGGRDVSDPENDFVGENESGAQSVPALRQITNSPTSAVLWIENLEKEVVDGPHGSLSYNKGDFIHYIDRATGNVFETYTHSLETKRLSNTTIPRLQEVLYESDEDIIFRYLDENDIVQTFWGHLEEQEGVVEKEVVGEFLPTNISQIVFGEMSGGVFYLKEKEGGSLGYFDDGSGTELVFDSPLSEWLPFWTDKNHVLLTTKPSSGVLGYSYELNTQNSGLRRVIGDKNALLTLPKEGGDVILFSEFSGSSASSFILKRNTNSVASAKFGTFPEKCAWSNVEDTVLYCAIPESFSIGTFPDNWYKGVISTSDSLWKIDFENDSVELVFSFDGYGHSFDITHPQISGDDQFFYFINKKDLSLWSAEL